MMANEKFEREKAYQITLHIARVMLRTGLLTEDEMKVIAATLKAKYAPPIGRLYP
jgi:hypothetical protein